MRTLEQKAKEAERARFRYHNNEEYRNRKKAKMRIWAIKYQENMTPEQKESHRIYERNRQKTPKRLAQKARAQNRYRNKLMKLGLYKYHRGNRAEQNRRWQNKPGNKIKRDAHLQVYSAVKRGLIKPQPCEKCSRKAVAHHDDYRKPLEVRWLCNYHHYEHHKSQP